MPEGEEITPQERLSRVVTLCEHFIRNVAYMRAARNEEGDLFKSDSEFWRVVHNNNLDIAVLEWCKLFADERGRHGWRQVVTDHDGFIEKLRAEDECSDEKMNSALDRFKTYRDKFVAHLDDERTMLIPLFDTAICATRVLFDHICDVEAEKLKVNAETRERFDETFEHHSSTAKTVYSPA